MPRKKSETKKAVWQRTFKLPCNVVAAFDAVCEHFDESGDRVARRFFEDSLRSLARDFGLHHVDEILGVEKRNPFDPMSSPKVYQEPYAGSAPGYSYQTPVYRTQEFTTVPMKLLEPAPIDTENMVLPSGGAPLSNGPVDE